MPTFVIKSEEDAWAFLVLSCGPSAPEFAKVVFCGWPQLTLVSSPGDGRGNRKTDRVVRLLQTQIDLTYALAKYGEPNTRRLTSRDRADIEIAYTVYPGSSVLKVYLEKVAEAFAKLADGMSSRDRHKTMVYSAVGIALVLVGGAVSHSYLRYRGETDRLKIALTQQTKQLELAAASHARSLEAIENVSKNTLSAIEASAYRSLWESSCGELSTRTISQ